MISPLPLTVLASEPEMNETELRSELELLDRQELESLIAAIYAQSGGLH